VHLSAKGTVALADGGAANERGAVGLNINEEG
jgi:hypothetical protein